MTFSQRLHTIRNQKGRTQQEMADLLGISHRAYQYYESGNREPNLTYLVQIADILDVSLDYLLCRDAYLAGKEDAHE